MYRWHTHRMSWPLACGYIQKIGVFSLAESEVDVLGSTLPFCR